VSEKLVTLAGKAVGHHVVAGKAIGLPTACLEGEIADIGATGIAQQPPTGTTGPNAKQNLPHDTTDA
jgi:hypothetical protein